MIPALAAAVIAANPPWLDMLAYLLIKKNEHILLIGYIFPDLFTWGLVTLAAFATAMLISHASRSQRLVVWSGLGGGAIVATLFVRAQTYPPHHLNTATRQWLLLLTCGVAAALITALAANLLKSTVVGARVRMVTAPTVRQRRSA